MSPSRKSPYAWVVLHYINVLNKPLSDARVRRAMRMAVDTNEVIQKAAFGAAVPSGPVPTGYGDWFIEPQSLPYLKPDVEGAKKLLAEAGYPNGFKIEIKCSPQYPEFVATTLVIQQSLKKIGIDVTATQMEWGAFVAENTKSNESCGKEGADIYASANTFRPDPDGFLYPYFHSKGDLNKGGCDRPTRSWTACSSRPARPRTTRSAAGCTRRPRASCSRRARTGGGTRSSTSRR